MLAEGRLLGIYPEGTRTPDGRLYRGKTGVARLALESGAPVIPCAMVGDLRAHAARQAAGRGCGIRPGVRFGKPLDFSRYCGLESDRLVLRAITDEIMYALMELSGQEYVDEYAQQAKNRLRSGPAARADAPAGRISTSARAGISADDAPVGRIGTSARAAVRTGGPGAGPRGRAARPGRPVTSGPGPDGA